MSRKEIVQKPASEIVPKLEESVNVLLRVIDRILKSPITKQDTYRQVGYRFLRRLGSELRRIRDMHDTRDAWLVARSSLEGTMLFDWITFGNDTDRSKSKKLSISEISEKEVRAQRYLAEIPREELKRIEFYEKLDSTPDSLRRQLPNLRKKARANLLKNSSVILTEKEAKLLKAGQKISLKKDFYEHLTGGKLWQIFAYAEAKEILERGVTALAGYHHWNPLWMVEAEWKDDGQFVIPESGGPDDYRMALEIGFVSTWMVAMYIALCYSPEESRLLDDLKKAVLAIHDK
jgi:hypothetical protein